MSKYLVTMEITTDDDPTYWNFDYFVNLSDGDDYVVTDVQEIKGE